MLTFQFDYKKDDKKKLLKTASNLAGNQRHRIAIASIDYRVNFKEFFKDFTDEEDLIICGLDPMAISGEVRVFPLF